MFNKAQNPQQRILLSVVRYTHIILWYTVYTVYVHILCSNQTGILRTYGTRVSFLGPLPCKPLANIFTWQILYSRMHFVCQCNTVVIGGHTIQYSSIKPFVTNITHSLKFMEFNALYRFQSILWSYSNMIPSPSTPCPLYSIPPWGCGIALSQNIFNF